MRFDPATSDDSPFPRGNCFCCGVAADAMWCGTDGEVRVCGGCAVTVLPKLIADAVGGIPRVAAMDAYRNRLVEVQANYWLAVACRTAAEARKRDTK